MIRERVIRRHGLPYASGELSIITNMGKKTVRRIPFGGHSTEMDAESGAGRGFLAEIDTTGCATGAPFPPNLCYGWATAPSPPSDDEAVPEVPPPGGTRIGESATGGRASSSPRGGTSGGGQNGKDARRRQKQQDEHGKKH